MLKLTKRAANDINLNNCISRLQQLEVASLEDVYWFEQTKVLGKDADLWSKVRQKLPTSKSQLETMKADLWSTIVKTSSHNDAWAWGDVAVWVSKFKKTS